MIEINCLNIFRFLAEVNTNLLRMHYFGQFKDHNSGKIKGNYKNDPIFFIYFLISNCQWYSFLHLKIAKTHFHGVLLSSILFGKIPEFRRYKLWDQNFVSFDSGNIHLKESEKTRFYFFFRVENQFCLMSWSTFACSRMLFFIGLKQMFWNFKPIFLRMQFSLIATFFSLLLVIFLSWNLHLKLSHVFLTIISFNIWRWKCKSIRSSHLELVTWHFGSQMVFPNI